MKLDETTSGINEAVYAEDDPRIVAALEQYRAALEAGARPDRRAFLADHEAIADILAECLDGLEFVNAVAPDLSGATGGLPSPFAEPLGRTGPATLGDYRLLREVGRGGMGVVYEAEQLSLGRRVALKVLPFAATLDPKHLQRFRNEAQAAAHLHHQNIVPVYAVGCERGVHYYAMQFIEGQTLAAIIDGHRLSALGDRPEAEKATAHLRAATTVNSLKPIAESREPTAAFVARLGVQAAEALEHAHQQGIIHRDIKPANLLIDERCQLWITDFGLARYQSDAQLTMSGDLLGTLRYMSPEQALAQHGLIDHRVDIYSLGATLYELLTSQPLFQGSDRQELLRRIAQEEPQSPRRINPTIPRELEIIVLKAVAKERAGRYGSAQEMADDLRRYLENRPILARPPTPLQRVRKWGRRHRAIVAVGGGAAVLLLLMAVIALSVSVVLIVREEQKKNDALNDAKANLETAEKERRRAEGNLREALEAVRRFYFQVGTGRLSAIPEADQVRRELLEDALKYFEAFLAQKRSDPALRYETAIACESVASLLEYLGRFDEAEKAYRLALGHFTELANAHPAEVKYRIAKASFQPVLARYCVRSGRTGEALVFLQEARTVANELLEEGVDQPYRLGLAELLHGVAYECRRLQQDAEAEDAFRKALKLIEQLRAAEPEALNLLERRAYYLNSFGILLRQLCRPREAEETHRAALVLLTAMGDGDAKLDLRHHLARTHGHLGAALWQLGQRDEAVEQTRKQIALCQGFAEARPGHFTWTELALAQHGLGQMLVALSQLTEAEEVLRQAAKLTRKLIQEVPGDPEHPDQVILTHMSLGTLLAKVGKDKEAEEAFMEVGNVYRLALERRPTDALANNNYAWFLVACPEPKLWDPIRAGSLATKAVELAPQDAASWHTLGVARYRTGDWEAATQALDKSIDLRKGGDSFEWFFLAMTCWQRGDKDQARRWFDKAVTWMEANKPKDQELKRFRQEAETLFKVP